MDPRIERTRSAVMDAATELLLERGPDGITVDGVVARSGVAKSTLYRHWPTRDALVTAVFAHLAPVVPTPPAELSYEASLRRIVDSIAEILEDDRWRPLIPALVLLKARHPDLAALEDSMNAQQMAVLEPVMAKGRQEGLLREDLSSELVAAVLVGPLLMGALTGVIALDDQLVDQVVELFLTATRPR